MFMLQGYVTKLQRFYNTSDIGVGKRSRSLRGINSKQIASK